MEANVEMVLNLGQFFLQQLLVVEIGVITVPRDQFIVGAELHNAAAVQNCNLVRIADRGHPVRNEDRAPASHDFAQVVQDFVLGVGVHARQGVVQNED